MSATTTPKATTKTTAKRTTRKPKVVEPVTPLTITYEPRDYAQGDTVLARHPRLHPDVSKATVLADFKAESSTYVRVQFPGSDDVVLTHKQNVGITV